MHSKMNQKISFLIRGTICVLFAVLFCAPMRIMAQNSVWGGVADVKGKAGKKVASTKQKMKTLKEQVQNWGLDTNYKHAFLIGGKLNSDGWSGCMNWVHRKSYNLNNFWQVSFSEIKDEKQIKQMGTGSYPQFGNPSPYIFGKINNLYTLQIGWGQEKLLLPAMINGNISLSFRCDYGFSLASLKPYYLKLVYIDYVGTTEFDRMVQQKYTRADSAAFLKPSAIMGASVWGKSVSDIQFVPGAYFEMSFAIIPSKTKMFVQTINLGVNASAYSKQLLVLAGQAPTFWKACLFAGIGIGKRMK